jgi:folate-binding protein YgfZ
VNAQFARLPGEALLHIAGPDTLTFLQGQTTCDTRQVDTARAVPGAYCTPQGRMVCDFLLAQLGEAHFGLRMRRDLLGTAATTFGKYIVFSRAELAAERDDWQVYACWGDGAAGAIGAALGAAPREQNAVVAGEGIRVLQLDSDGRRFEIWLAQDADPDPAAALAASTQQATEADWRAEQVLAAAARIEAATTGLFLPQDLNYDRTGLVNFRKGCYTGQEIVARLHYRGTPKRRCYPALLAGAAASAGDALFTSGGNQSIGHVVNTAPHNGDCLMLVCAASSALEQGLLLGSPEGPALTLLDMPYALSDDAT